MNSLTKIIVANIVNSTLFDVQLFTITSSEPLPHLHIARFSRDVASEALLSQQSKTVISAVLSRPITFDFAHVLFFFSMVTLPVTPSLIVIRGQI